MKNRKSARWVVVLAAAATSVLAIGPFSGTAGAGTESTIPTRLVAHSIVADINDKNLQARVPLRPNAHLYAKTESGRVPLAGQFVQFFAAGQDLCVDKTDANGYAECDGIVRLTFPLLALGRYTAVHPEQPPYGKSSDTGQLITIGSLSLL